jgi:hypothetical protein
MTHSSPIPIYHTTCPLNANLRPHATVEFGLMSTTTDRKTASAYSGVARNRGTIFEISAGQIDNGASISFLSQYPGEAEFLMPPLCSLEVAPLTTPYVSSLWLCSSNARWAGHGKAARRPHALWRGQAHTGGSSSSLPMQQQLHNPSCLQSLSLTLLSSLRG